MIKILALVAIFVIAVQAQIEVTTWRPGHPHPNCVDVDPLQLTLFPGSDCCSFYKCERGNACKFFY